MAGLSKTNITSLEKVYSGKVRESYAVGEDKLLIVATDRISAFDVILDDPIPGKGKVLTALTNFWFDKLDGVLPNHLTGIDPETVVKPEEVEQVRGRAVVAMRLKPILVECVARGYLIGGGWKDYCATGSVCGVKLPEGMKENQKFPEPIITPTTKAEIGEHDADISKEEILAKGLATPEEYAILEKYTMALFKRGTEIAAERGLILVDTKYEFGKHNGTIYLMDEIHTPDSSRYFYSEGYEERFAKGEPQKQLSKEFVREWLMDNGFQGKEGQQVPEKTDEIVTSISERYIELYEHITGEKFVKEDTSNIAERIEKNVTEYLK